MTHYLERRGPKFVRFQACLYVLQSNRIAHNTKRTWCYLLIKKIRKPSETNFSFFKLKIKFSFCDIKCYVQVVINIFEICQ